MDDNINVLYIHGMGGGGDSRIPSILNEHVPENISVIVRTYSFDPEIAWGQISSWLEELKPALVIGESLGALNAIRISGVPHLLVSPSLNAPLYVGYLAFLALLPGVTPILDRVYRPRKYRALRRRALSNSPAAGGKDYFHAFFGMHDHYRRSGIVSVRTWKRFFGPKDSFTMYDGTHFMEEEFVVSMLLPKIISLCPSCNE